MRLVFLLAFSLFFASSFAAEKLKMGEGKPKHLEVADSKNNPNNFDYKTFNKYVSEGNDYLKVGNRLSAIQSYEKALSISPNQTALMINLIDLYSVENRNEDALNLYITLFKTEPFKYFSKVNDFFDLLKEVVTKNPDKVGSFIDGLQAVYKTEPKIFSKISYFYFEIGDNEKALQYVDLAIKNSNSSYYFYQKALIYDAMDNTQEAYNSYQQFFSRYKTNESLDIDIHKAQKRFLFLRSLIQDVNETRSSN